MHGYVREGVEGGRVRLSQASLQHVEHVSLQANRWWLWLWVGDKGGSGIGKWLPILRWTKEAETAMHKKRFILDDELIGPESALPGGSPAERSL